MKTILAIDFDENAVRTYRANFPGVDCRSVKVEDAIADLPHADVVIGGPPCQSFSLAGKGLGDADPRNGWPAYVAGVAKVMPRMFLAENVAGMLTRRHLPYLTKVVSALGLLGYFVETKELDAVNFGVPQFRNRIWLWGIRRDVYAAGARHCWPKPTHAWPWREAGMFGGELQPAVTVGWALNIPHRQTDGVWFGGGSAMRIVGGTMQAHGGRAEAPFRIDAPSDTLRGAVPGCSDAQIKVMGGGRNDIDRGNGHFERDERDITPEPSTTITGKFMGTHKGAQNPRVVEEVREYHHSEAMLAKHPPASPASTVQAKFYKGGAEGLLQVSEDGRTWDSRHAPATPATPAPTTRARSPRDGGRCTENVIKEGLKVRRLSVWECARLMSMPDSFRWPEKISKTAMYKIIGNGACSLMGHHMALALQKADPQSETIISLFCGGGVMDVGIHGRFWSLR